MTNKKPKKPARAEVRRLEAEVIKAAFWWKHKYDKSGCAFSDALYQAIRELAKARAGK